MSKRAGGSRSVGAESALSNRLSEPAEPPAKKAKAYVEKGATAAANENGKGKEVWDGTRLLYFLGPQGTYSHQVARTLLPLMQRRKDGSQVKLMPVDTIVNTTKRAARRTQTTGEISYALLPFENNINGPVHESYDILYNLSNLDDVGFSVVEESYLPVSHCLMCTKQTYAELTKESPGEPQLDRIQVVSSHWQVCSLVWGSPTSVLKLTHVIYP